MVRSKLKGIREACVAALYSEEQVRQETGEQPEASTLLLLSFQENQSWIYLHRDCSDAFCSKMVEQKGPLHDSASEKSQHNKLHSEDRKRKSYRNQDRGYRRTKRQRNSKTTQRKAQNGWKV